MDNFGKRLRGLRKRNRLTQKSLAKHMGVGQTTIANYENSSRFPNPDILKSFADFFDVSIDYLVGRNNILNTTNSLNFEKQMPLNLELDYDDIIETYSVMVREGNVNHAYNTLLNLVKSGLSLQELYDNIITPSLVKIGSLWEKNELSVGEEHLFTEITKKLISHLYFHYPILSHNDFNALFICANGERHSIGLRMVSDILEQDGWNVYFLGTDLPLDSIVQMIKEKNIDLIAISSTMDYNINSIKSIIENIRSSNINKNIKFLVGGRPFNINNSIVKFVDADGYASNCKEAVEISNKLIKD